MRRIQWIELHEQPWFPSSLRDEVTDARCQQIVVRCPWTPQIPAFSRSSPVDWTVWVEDTNSPMKVLKSSPWARHSCVFLAGTQATSDQRYLAEDFDVAWIAKPQNLR